MAIDNIVTFAGVKIHSHHVSSSLFFNLDVIGSIFFNILVSEIVTITAAYETKVFMTPIGRNKLNSTETGVEDVM